MQHPNNTKRYNISEMMLLLRYDFEVLHDDLNLGYDVSLYGLLVSNILEADG